MFIAICPVTITFQKILFVVAEKVANNMDGWMNGWIDEKDVNEFSEYLITLIQSRKFYNWIDLNGTCVTCSV